jgi:hypothetical protein
MRSFPSARKQLVFSYDYMSRRVQKVVSTCNGSDYANPVTTRFVYDGWNLLAELERPLYLRSSCEGDEGKRLKNRMEEVPGKNRSIGYPK